MASDRTVRAAGVVLLRDNAGVLETLIVHRPHRSDWSLPKGKLEPGEHPAVAAVRECDEETGYQVHLGAPLGHLEYVALGLPKRVDYWVAYARGDEGFIPGDEIDEIRWLPVAQARAHLTYVHDADLVERAASLPPTSPLIVLRHTQAVKRSDYKGKVDAERPLSGRGRSQAKLLTPLLEAFGVEEVHSSDSTRCMQTVKRFAKARDTGIQAEVTISEEAFRDNPERSARRMGQLIADPAPLVVCSHRPVIPTLLEAAATRLNVPIDDELWNPKMPPGGFIVIHRAFVDGSGPSLVAIERHIIEPE